MAITGAPPMRQLTLRGLRRNISVASTALNGALKMTDTHTIAARQTRLATIMERIADSYSEVRPKIHHLDRMPLPSRDDAAAIMQALEEIIFPGYHSTDGVTHHSVIYRVQERTGWLFEHLREQVSRGFHHMKQLDGELSFASDEQAEECAYQF